jgi:hypothetical protein
VFENRVLRTMFGPKMDGGRGEWRKLLIEELRDMYFLTNIIGMIKSKRVRWVRYEREEMCIPDFFVGKRRHRWDDNNKMRLKKK